MAFNPRRRRWLRNGRLAAAVVAVGLGFNYHSSSVEAKNPPSKPTPERVAPRKEKEIEKPTAKTASPAKPVRKEIPIPTVLPVFSEIPKGGSWCARYARLYAEKMYGIKYNRGDAWRLAALNKSLWKIPKMDHYAGNPTQEFAKYAKQGNLLGIYYPSSGNNEKVSTYTHVVVVDGVRNGKIVVTNHISGKTTRENLDDLLKRLSHYHKTRNNDGKKAAVFEVIGPRD